MNEAKILNTIIACTLLLMLTILLAAGIPMWSVWSSNAKALAEYEQVKKTNRLAELTAKSELRRTKINAEIVKVMGGACAKYCSNPKFKKSMGVLPNLKKPAVIVFSGGSLTEVKQSQASRRRD